MNITLEELTAIIRGSSQTQDHQFNIGAKYFIRTVTMSFTGVLVSVGDKELVIKEAAWISDSGKSEFDEVEMFPKNNKVIIGRGSIIDATEVNEIPTSQK